MYGRRRFSSRRSFGARRGFKRTYGRVKRFAKRLGSYRVSRGGIRL